jgi:hypothetical protein
MLARALVTCCLVTGPATPAPDHRGARLAESASLGSAALGSLADERPARSLAAPAVSQGASGQLARLR